MMRLIVFFDLPVTTDKNRRDYRQFRKNLLNEGFLMIQESVYVRVAVNKQSAEFLEKRVGEFCPSQGLIQTLIVTEKQYTSMHFLSGEAKKDVRNTNDRLVVI